MRQRAVLGVTAGEPRPVSPSTVADSLDAVRPPGIACAPSPTDRLESHWTEREVDMMSESAAQIVNKPCPSLHPSRSIDTWAPCERTVHWFLIYTFCINDSVICQVTITAMKALPLPPSNGRAVSENKLRYPFATIMHLALLSWLQKIAILKSHGTLLYVASKANARRQRQECKCVRSGWMCNVCSRAPPMYERSPGGRWRKRKRKKKENAAPFR